MLTVGKNVCAWPNVEDMSVRTTGLGLPVIQIPYFSLSSGGVGETEVLIFTRPASSPPDPAWRSSSSLEAPASEASNTSNSSDAGG